MTHLGTGRAGQPSPAVRAGGALGRRAALAMAAAGALSAGRARAAEPTRGGVLRAVTYANPSSLDPITGRAGSDHVVLYTMFDTLIEWEPDTLLPRPGLAQAWSFPDPRTLVLSLRDGVRFHDGTTFDAEAVRVNLDRALYDKRSNVSEVGSIAAIEIPDPRTVVLRLKQPDTALPLILSDRAGMMVSPKSIAGAGDATDRNPVGTGPWRFVRWDDGNRVVVTRHEGYWRDGLPWLDGIDFRIITDPGTALRSVVAGQSDFAFRLQPQQLAAARRARGVVAGTGPNLALPYGFLRLNKPPLDRVEVRQAMNCALDRAGMATALTAGLGEPTSIPLPSSHWAYDAEAAHAYPFDPGRARQLLDAAGHKDGIDLDCLIFSDPSSVQRMEVIVQQWAQVGIRAKVRSGSVAQANTWWHEGQYDFHLASWTGRPDPSMTYEIFGPASYFNAGQVEVSPRLTQALADTRQVADIPARKEAFRRAERLEREFAMGLPLYFEPMISARSDRVQGYVANLTGKPRFDGVWLRS